MKGSKVIYILLQSGHYIVDLNCPNLKKNFKPYFLFLKYKRKIKKFCTRKTLPVCLVQKIGLVLNNFPRQILRHVHCFRH